MIHNGTKPQKKDLRKYSYHRTFGSVAFDMSSVPLEFNFDAGFGMPDQEADGLSQGCTGYTQTELCQDEDMVRYDPRFTYDKTLQMEGITKGDADFEKVGCVVQDSIKSLIVYGVKPTGDNSDPFSHRRGNYYDTLNSSGLDCFDSICKAMWMNFKNTGKRRTVSIATPWFLEFNLARNGIVPNTIKYSGREQDYNWHNWKIAGFKKINGILYAVGKIWQGERMGDAGWMYFDRQTINTLLAIEGTLADMILPFDGTTILNVRLTIMETIASYIRNFIKNLFKKPMINDPAPIEQIVQQPVIEESVAIPLQWDTPEHAEASAHALCSQSGLAADLENTVCAVIEAESGFKNTAKNVNKNASGVATSTDWGICQINDHYHIGEGKDFPSVDYVIQNPDKCVQWMIDMAKAGHITMWSAYNNGSYKKYLK